VRRTANDANARAARGRLESDVIGLIVTIRRYNLICVNRALRCGRRRRFGQFLTDIIGYNPCRLACWHQRHVDAVNAFGILRGAPEAKTPRQSHYDRQVRLPPASHGRVGSSFRLLQRTCGLIMNSQPFSQKLRMSRRPVCAGPRAKPVANKSGRQSAGRISLRDC